jgi:Tfp pilus assembly protein FimT
MLAAIYQTHTTVRPYRVIRQARTESVALNVTPDRVGECCDSRQCRNASRNECGVEVHVLDIGALDASG